MLTGAQINDVTVQTLSLVFTGSLPAMLACAIAGLSISLLQALTQVQDQGLPTAVKFFAVMATLYMTYLTITNSIVLFTDKLFVMISQL